MRNPAPAAGCVVLGLLMVDPLEQDRTCRAHESVARVDDVSVSVLKSGEQTWDQRGNLAVDRRAKSQVASEDPRHILWGNDASLRSAARVSSSRYAGGGTQPADADACGGGD